MTDGDPLTQSIKALMKEAVREVLRESEFTRSTLTVERVVTPVLPTPPKKLAVKIEEAAEMLSLSIPTVRRLISNGSLKVSRKTRHILIPVSELDRLMKV